MPTMPGYTKLFNSILASTIWRADNVTRIVWITLLAMSDKNGVAECSIPGLADLARVSVSQCRKAVKNLASPDPDSRSHEYEGRRIEEVDGGFRILNHGKYRAKLNADERREYNRIKQQEYRNRQKLSADVNDVNDECMLSAHTSPSPNPSLRTEFDGEIAFEELCKAFPKADRSQTCKAIFFRDVIKVKKDKGLIDDSVAAGYIITRARMYATLRKPQFQTNLYKWLDGEMYLQPDSAWGKEATTTPKYDLLDKIKADLEGK